MNQTEKRLFLIRYLLDEQPRYRDMQIPSGATEQKKLLRSLFNIRMPGSISDEFLSVQDEYLRVETAGKGITDISVLKPVADGIYLWQGDITTLRCGAIVNAANSGMTGCYRPCHNCIDNCIHTYAGVQLRNYCAGLMEKQGYEEPTGQAKITPAFNLPCEYILHTVGPTVSGSLTEKHERQLASCYRSCLALAEENGVESVAFCCVSTGVFGFPQERAAQIATETVRKYKNSVNSNTEVIFNVFTDADFTIYSRLLG